MSTFASSFPTFQVSRIPSAGTDFFPPELWEVPRPPAELFIQGDPGALSLLSKLPERGLAIVGSRECQLRSVRLVKSSLAALSGFDLVIVSGLARGIDAQAHLSAIEARLPTIAILGCGLRRSYPPENEELRARILDSGGLVISEFPPDAEPKADHFIRRNRLIAGWTRATWVVEAGFRSGAINTATWAKQQDRSVFITPCYPGDPTLAGNQRLLESDQVIEGSRKPFWSERSLAEVWLELESFFARPGTPGERAPRRRKHRYLTLLPASSLSFAKELQSEVHRRSLEQGGVMIGDLIHWSRQQGQSPDLFFPALRAALEQGWVSMRCGILAATDPTAEG